MGREPVWKEAEFFAPCPQLLGPGILVSQLTGGISPCPHGPIPGSEMSQHSQGLGLPQAWLPYTRSWASLFTSSAFVFPSCVELLGNQSCGSWGVGDTALCSPILRPPRGQGYMVSPRHRQQTAPSRQSWAEAGCSPAPHRGRPGLEGWALTGCAQFAGHRSWGSGISVL